MPVVVTFVARIKDWKRLQQLNQESLIEEARESGATRYCLFRNGSDAAELMVMLELANYDAAQELAHTLNEEIHSLLANGEADTHIWEPLGWEEIR
jgi:hypothetical protein